MDNKEKSFSQTMRWLKSSDTPTVTKLKNRYVMLGVEKKEANVLAKSYRYIIDMLNNVSNYKLKYKR